MGQRPTETQNSLLGSRSVMLPGMEPKKSSNMMHVLIIDDEDHIRRTTAVVLETMGHHTASAQSGEVALKQLESDHFDIAFLDLKLNGESGLDLLPELLKLNPRL